MKNKAGWMFLTGYWRNKMEKHVTLDPKTAEKAHYAEFAEADRESSRSAKVSQFIRLSESYIRENNSKVDKEGFVDYSFQELKTLRNALTEIYHDLPDLVTEDMFNRDSKSSMIYFNRFEKMYQKLMPELETELELRPIGGRN